MGRIGHFIGVDADQPFADLGQQAVQIDLLESGLIAQVFDQMRLQQRSKGRMAAKLHFE